MTPEQHNELQEALPEQPAKKAPAVAKQLVDLALSRFTFLRGTDGQAYAVCEGNPLVPAAARQGQLSSVPRDLAVQRDRERAVPERAG